MEDKMLTNFELNSNKNISIILFFILSFELLLLLLGVYSYFNNQLKIYKLNSQLELLSFSLKEKTSDLGDKINLNSSFMDKFTKLSEKEQISNISFFDSISSNPILVCCVVGVMGLGLYNIYYTLSESIASYNFSEDLLDLGVSFCELEKVTCSQLAGDELERTVRNTVPEITELNSEEEVFTFLTEDIPILSDEEFITQQIQILTDAAKEHENLENGVEFISVISDFL
jgi:hypothetical protein